MQDEEPTPSAADEADAPPPWRPISGFALTAFILAFACGLLTIAGLWAAAVIPLLLGVLGVLTIRRNGKRGRLLAIFAILMAIGFGSCSFIMNSQGKAMFSQVPESLLAVMSARASTEASKTETLKRWAWPKALKANPDLVAEWLAGYGAIEAEYGSYLDDYDRGSIFGSFMMLVMPPEGVEEIRPKPGADLPAPGGAIWVHAHFEKGRVWVCVVLGTGTEDFREALIKAQATEKGSEGKPRPVVGAVRYFRPKSGAKPKGT